MKKLRTAMIYITESRVTLVARQMVHLVPQKKDAAFGVLHQKILFPNLSDM